MCLSVKSGARGYKPRHIRNSDNNPPAAVIQSLGINGIIMVARICGVDGDKRCVAPVFERTRGRRRIFGIVCDILGEFVWNVMLFNRNLRDQMRVVAPPQYGQYFGGG